MGHSGAWGRAKNWWPLSASGKMTKKASSEQQGTGENMAASDNLSEGQFGKMYHGTRANVGNFVFPVGPTGMAYATSDPERARLYAETKFDPQHKDNPVQVLEVTPVQPDEVESVPGEHEAETHYRSRQGFMVTGKHS